MTKDELRKALEGGKQLDELFEFTSGQECQIFKAKGVARFAGNHEIVYIPDTDLNKIDTDRVLASLPEIECVLMFCFTGQDFFTICDRNEKMASRVFDACDWQCPDTEYDEQQREEEEDPDTRENNPFAEEGVIACQFCRSGEWLYNEDGAPNAFCGQCGRRITWPEASEEAAARRAKE